MSKVARSDSYYPRLLTAVEAQLDYCRMNKNWIAKSLLGVSLALVVSSGNMAPVFADSSDYDPRGTERSTVSSGYAPRDTSPISKREKAAARYRRLAAGSSRSSDMAGVYAKSMAWAPNINRIQQPNGYYCGPATLLELVNAKYIYPSWDEAAAILGTTTDGTAWWTDHSPMAAALNHYLGPDVHFSAVGLNWTPTALQQKGFKEALIFNIADRYGIAGNAYEVIGGPHLEGHPTNEVIHHWFAINGYDDYGATAYYVDSSNPAWPGWEGVPTGNIRIETTKLVNIMGDRGYVW